MAGCFSTTRIIIYEACCIIRSSSTAKVQISMHDVRGRRRGARMWTLRGVSLSMADGGEQMRLGAKIQRARLDLFVVPGQQGILARNFWPLALTFVLAMGPAMFCSLSGRGRTPSQSDCMAGRGSGGERGSEKPSRTDSNL